MRIGSMFSGVGGLDLAVLQLLEGSSMAWHAEIDPAASKALAFHWPAVPNLGDVAAVDWSTVEPVDVITAGFPCQDVSLAGQRAGMKEGTRSGLWLHVAAAIGELCPRFVLLENVRGLLSADAVRPMEFGQGPVGDVGSRHVLRALGAVLGDLADLGFDAEWTCLAASAVGAAHRRERVFVLAFPADSDVSGSQGPQPTRGHNMPAGGGDKAVALLPTPSVADGTGGHTRRSGARSDELLLGGIARAAVAGQLLPTPRSSDGEKGGPNQRGSSGDLMLPSAVVRWGDYERAIRRQEAVSRPAPEPTSTNANGQQRLSPAFAEWLMFWPPGWVTDPAIGLSRTDQLRCIGNGVVPPQAATAFGRLLAMAGQPVGGAA